MRLPLLKAGVAERSGATEGFTARPASCHHHGTLAATTPGALTSLMRLVSVSQVVFGTDYPFRTSIDHVRGLAAYFSGADLRAIEKDNAVKLIPRLA